MQGSSATTICAVQPFAARRRARSQPLIASGLPRRRPAGTSGLHCRASRRRSPCSPPPPPSWRHKSWSHRSDREQRHIPAGENPKCSRFRTLSIRRRRHIHLDALAARRGDHGTSIERGFVGEDVEHFPVVDRRWPRATTTITGFFLRRQLGAGHDGGDDTKQMAASRGSRPFERFFSERRFSLPCTVGADEDRGAPRDADLPVRPRR